VIEGTLLRVMERGTVRVRVRRVAGSDEGDDSICFRVWERGAVTVRTRVRKLADRAEGDDISLIT
jgi:hypothetical protein